MRRAGERRAGCTVAHRPLGRHPGAAQQKTIRVLRTCRGSSWVEVFLFFLYNQNWKKYTKLFFINQSKVVFSELPMAFLEHQNAFSKIGGTLI